jgi:(2Fe-2S) ferredoxin
MRPRLDVLICGGGACISSHSREFKNKLTEEIKAKGLSEEINLIETGCMGPCQLGPVMVVYPDGSFYVNLKEEHAETIVLEHFLKGRPVPSLLWTTPEARKIVEEQKQVPFFEKQKKIVLALCGKIDPENIEEYIAQRGYEALGTALTTLKPEEVIDIMTKSGLRGRGGAGFPTGLKWKFARANQAPQKFVICNADEATRGPSWTAAVLRRRSPCRPGRDGHRRQRHRRQRQGYIYARAEYPLAIRRLNIAIKQAAADRAARKEYLSRPGSNSTSTSAQGAGAFVCGEETALMRLHRGPARYAPPRPPFPASKGLWQEPTIINNVETLANIRHIFLNGWEWYREHRHRGQQGHQGLRAFRESEQHRPGRGAHGHPLGSWSSTSAAEFPAGKGLQGRADRRPLGRMRPPKHLEHPHRLRGDR